jgi:hypothetical protein
MLAHIDWQTATPWMAIQTASQVKLSRLGAERFSSAMPKLKAKCVLADAKLET